MKAALLSLLLCSCAGERQALKGSVWPAVGAGAGAALGSLAGPMGTIGGAAIGGGAGHLFGENASLRTGELQGGGAADREAERWRGEALYQNERAEGLWTWIKRLLWISAGAAALVVGPVRRGLFRAGRSVAGRLVAGAKKKAGGK